MEFVEFVEFVRILRARPVLAVNHITLYWKLAVEFVEFWGESRITPCISPLDRYIQIGFKTTSQSIF